MMKSDTRIGAYEAKTKLPELIRRVEAGERITITNRGVPVVELRPIASSLKAGAREAVARMKWLSKISGIPARTVRALIEEGRR